MMVCCLSWLHAHICKDGIGYDDRGDENIENLEEDDEEEFGEAEEAVEEGHSKRKPKKGSLNMCLYYISHPTAKVEKKPKGVFNSKPETKKAAPAPQPQNQKMLSFLRGTQSTILARITIY